MIPGLKLSEMRHNRENSLCCRAVAMLSNPKIGLSIAVKRVREAVEANADINVTNCSGCLSALTFASHYSKADVKVRDITDLLMEALGMQPEKTKERIISYMEKAAKMLEGSRVTQGKQRL
ncbi:hypothetical protein Hbut_1611 [Hyperthermus butylicus DSM 5456]|uniref:Cysteine-rich domain-containing protein n=2 Tax=Hyperthermus butylicus TaxID=54248 RepID=A2BN68_HYPBU|nr:hypothetical protein Hbut_1611 [Hyperthermus butylicus DSM 5456]